MRRNNRMCIAVLATVMVIGCVFSGCKKGGETIPEDITPTPGVGEVSDDGSNGDKTSRGYTDSPELRRMVDAGLLPAVEKRLPGEDVFTVEGVATGQYGDDVQFAAEHADDITGALLSEGLFRYAEDGTIAPNIAKGYAVNSDFTKYTIYLRKGMRWSDGELFTAEDCIFFYEKMCLPETFGEPLWKCFTVTDAGGKQGKAVFRKVDAYSFEVIFPTSKPEFLQQLLEQGGICFAPEHYHVNLLPDYMGTDAAKAKAADMGYKDIAEMLRETVVNAWNTPGVPTLNPFCISQEEGENDVKGNYYEFVRNPYYWKVDKDGKQLPYMERLGFTRISGESQKMLLTTEGFLSVSPLTAEQVPEAQSGTGRGDYRIITWTQDAFYAVKNSIKNFPETCPYEEVQRGIGAAHIECWYTE